MRLHLLSVNLLKACSYSLFCIKERVKNSLDKRHIIGTCRMKHNVSTAMKTNHTFTIGSGQHDCWPEIVVGCVYSFTDFRHIGVICLDTGPHWIPYTGISRSELHMKVLALVAYTQSAIFIDLRLASQFR